MWKKYLYVRDHQGSVLALLDAETGGVADSYEYEPYGLPHIYNANGTEMTESAVGNRMLYTGREWDPMAKVYHYRHRVYSPVEKRFLQRDPIGLAGGWNEYACCRGNPVNATDPMGLLVIWNPTTYLDPWMGWGHAISGGGNGIVYEGVVMRASTGSAAFIDGVIPFADPLASHGLYNRDCDIGTSFSRFIGQTTRDIEIALLPGAIAQTGVRAGPGLFYVTSWAPEGVAPIVGTGGGWVMLGKPNWIDWILSGTLYPYSNSATAIVSRAALSSPMAKEGFIFGLTKGLIGQRVLPAAAACGAP